MRSETKHFNVVLMFLFMATLIPANSIAFSLQIKHYTRICFDEFITTSTPYHFKVSAPASNFQLSLIFHDGKILQKNTKQTEEVKKINSYAAVTAEYKFCVQNFAETQTFKIEYLSGLELADKAALPEDQDSKMIEKSIDELNQSYSKVKEQEHYSITVNELNMQLQKSVSFKAVGFGFLSITVVLVISFLNYLEIKRVLRNRKII